MFLGTTPDMWQTIGVIFAIIVGVIGGIAYIIKSIFKLGKFSQRIGNVETAAHGLQNEISTLTKQMSVLIGKVSIIAKDHIADDLSEAHSPRQLNDRGRKVLKDSSIEETLSPLFNEIVDMVREKHPENPYQAQEDLFDVVQSFREDTGITQAVENGAFLSGHTPEEVLYVGALNIRDKVIEELGLEVGDIDKHDPGKPDVK